MGRKKGGKNKPKIEGVARDKLRSEEITLTPSNATPSFIKRGRGRPKGNKGKPKEIKETSLEIKQLKRQIKDLRAEKLRLPSGSKDRIELHRKIKELKLLLTEKKELKTDKIAEISQSNIDKEPLITEILLLQEQYKINPTFESLGIDLYKYNIEQLQKHIECIKRKREIKEVAK